MKVLGQNKCSTSDRLSDYRSSQTPVMSKGFPARRRYTASITFPRADQWLTRIVCLLASVVGRYYPQTKEQDDNFNRTVLYKTFYEIVTMYIGNK